MNKLSKEKRDLLLGIAIGAVALMAALYFLLADAQKTTLAAMQKKTHDILSQLEQGMAVKKTGPDVAAVLAARKAELEKREVALALATDRDPYAWMVSTINPFILPRKNFNIGQVKVMVPSEPEKLLGKSPYKIATFKIQGLAFYEDFGKFCADFENTFPFFRIQNWEMNPAGGTGADVEKLNVTFEIVAPIKPQAGEAAK